MLPPGGHKLTPSTLGRGCKKITRLTSHGGKNLTSHASLWLQKSYSAQPRLSDKNLTQKITNSWRQMITNS
jgi:hypothetical protein